MCSNPDDLGAWDRGNSHIAGCQLRDVPVKNWRQCPGCVCIAG